MSEKLGHLKYLKLNQVWPHEEKDFTPWLAQEANLASLANELGLELQFEQMEVPVGPYSADILAKDATGRSVVIENQFNKTNHDHLGKLITYGATLGASIVIWIAEQFTEEHQRAIEWLNERTTEDLVLYAVQPRVFQIDDSKPAVEFRIVERPNELVKSASLARALADVSESQKVQLEFWTLFRDRLLEKKVIPSARSAKPQYWYDVPLGRSYFALSNILNTVEGRVGVRVYIHNHVATEAMQQLLVYRPQIEAEIGTELLWNPNPEKRDKVISLTRPINLEDRASWAEAIDWLVDMTAKFRSAFMPRLKDLQFSQPTNPPAI